MFKRPPSRLRFQWGLAFLRCLVVRMSFAFFPFSVCGFSCLRFLVSSKIVVRLGVSLGAPSGLKSKESPATLNTNAQKRRFRVGRLQNQLLVHHFQKMHFTRPWPCETPYFGHRYFYRLFQKLTNVCGETPVFEKTDESPTTLNTNLQKLFFRVGRLHIQKMRAQSCKIVFFQSSSSCMAFAITET